MWDKSFSLDLGPVHELPVDKRSGYATMAPYLELQYTVSVIVTEVRWNLDKAVRMALSFDSVAD